MIPLRTITCTRELARVPRTRQWLQETVQITVEGSIKLWKSAQQLSISSWTWAWEMQMTLRQYSQICSLQCQRPYHQATRATRGTTWSSSKEIHLSIRPTQTKSGRFPKLPYIKRMQAHLKLLCRIPDTTHQALAIRTSPSLATCKHNKIQETKTSSLKTKKVRLSRTWRTSRFSWTQSMQIAWRHRRLQLTTPRQWMPSRSWTQGECRKELELDQSFKAAIMVALLAT